MSKPKYVISNGDHSIGILWENEKLGKVLVVDGKIDMNFDLEIYNIDTQSREKNIDLRDFILEAMPSK